MNPDEERRIAHLARRGKRGQTDPAQRKFDQMKRDGMRWCENPGKAGYGMWCAPGWEPDFFLGYPVFPVKQ
jgi:hypothetical protein